MYIFYDFETSSRELIGQIMTYAFVVTDAALNPVDMLEGAVRLRPTELPEIEAILVNRIDVTTHQRDADLEQVAAGKIFQFLSKWIQKSGTCALIGYNSNQFDLGFLRNLLIHYGYNPYFYGKLQAVDILHFSQHIAFQNPDNFPWIKVENPNSTYYSFTMEDLAFSFGLLTGKQTHSAVDDVNLLIALTKALQDRYEVPLATFKAVSWHLDQLNQTSYQLVRVKQRHFAKEGESLSHFVYKYYGIVSHNKKQWVVVSLDKLHEIVSSGEKWSDEDLLAAMRSVNENKSFFIGEPVGDNCPDGYAQLAETVFLDPLIQACAQNPDSYFEKIKKDWDIDYQIHELGFDRMDRLSPLIAQLQANPDAYSKMVTDLWAKREGPKDRYLVQLFNRAYLWTHPAPQAGHLEKYLRPRYITGEMLRNPEEMVSLESRLSKMKAIIAGDSHSDSDKQLTEQLLAYYRPICQQLGVSV